MNEHNKAYALIVASVNKEVSHHNKSIKYSWGDLKKLKYLYDSHSKLELIQLLLNLFNLHGKDNGPMTLASKIKSVMHDIDSIDVKIGIAIMAFIRCFF
jgi:hypothetical protein